MPKLISLVIPVHNEEKNLPALHAEIEKVWHTLDGLYACEIIFVDDGSRDNSAREMERLAEADSRVKFLLFSRNFGKELATSAGLHAAAGDAAIVLDADLQHPPELIPDFLAKWRKGAPVVIGVRTENEGEGFMKRWGSRLFNRLNQAISETGMLPGSTDFRLLDRAVIEEFKKLTERNRITRGLIDWLGFPNEIVQFRARPRKYGTAAYGIIKLSRLALNSFVSHSLFPLRLAGYLGVGIVCLSGPLGLFLVIEKYIFHDPWELNVTGSASLGVLLLFLIGIVLCCLGLIALYIAHIHAEVSGRPLYVVKKRSYNMDSW